MAVNSGQPPLLFRMLSAFCVHFLPDQSQRGSLFTFFLNNPLMAFLFVSGLSSMRKGLWDKCHDYLRKINRDIAQLLTHSRSIGMYCRYAQTKGTMQLKMNKDDEFVIFTIFTHLSPIQSRQIDVNESDQHYMQLRVSFPLQKFKK